MKDCPQPAQLADFVAGRLDVDLLNRVAGHIDQCPVCAAALTVIEVDADTLAVGLKQLPAERKYGHELKFKEALARAERIGCQNSPAVREPSAHAATDDRAPRFVRDYEILEKLGQGGMGVVYKARHTKLKRDVALKLLPAERLQDAEVVRRFEREMEAVGKLAHPNIVSAFDAGEVDGMHFLAMEWVDGVDLAALVGQRGPLPVADACELIRQAAWGLRRAHECGLVHRDIKPSNLMLDTGGTVKILDLGLARLASAGEDQDQLTCTGQVAGTIDYMAPEQALDTRSADARADIYSLGVTLWNLLTGRKAYEGKSAMAKLLAHRESPVPSLQAACPSAPPQLDEIFARMVAKAPEDRYQSMSEVIAALERCSSGFGASPLLAPAPGNDNRQQAGEPWRTTQTASETTVAGSSELDPAATRRSPQVDADPYPQHALASPLNAASAARRLPRSLWPKQRLVWLATGGGMLVLLVAASVFFLQSRGGVIPAEINVPPADWSPGLAVAPFDEYLAKQHQQAWANHLGQPLEREVGLPGGAKLTMILIPPGEFLMGSTAEEQHRFLKEAKAANDTLSAERIPTEGPQHRVRISRPFWLSQHEVTIAQFRQFVEAENYTTEAERDGDGGFGIADGVWVQAPKFVWDSDIGTPQTDDGPVLNVSWNDAMAFCRWLSKQQDGWAYKLPTEAQWEYACRAGKTTYWHSGDTDRELQQHGWFNVLSGGQIHPVGQLEPNAFGLYDMHGNVWEWCADWHTASYNASALLVDPGGPLAGSGRVLRGGSWDNDARNCRSASRPHCAPDYRGHNVGFRLAAVLAEK